MVDRKIYMRKYYQQKKVELRNASLIRSNKEKLLKAKRDGLYEEALYNLLVNNRRRRYIWENKIEYKQVILTFD